MIDPNIPWVFARLVSGQQLNGEIDILPNPYKAMAIHLETLQPADRTNILTVMVMALQDSQSFLNSVINTDPTLPCPAVDLSQTVKFATADDLRKTMSSIQWTHEGWIPASSIVGIAALEGTGESRFELDICRRVYHSDTWPDGQKITVPARSPSLWVCADGQHDEMANMASEFRLPGDAIIFPAPPNDPYANTSLDDPEIFKWIKGAIETHKPWAIFIDSLTYATTRDLSEQKSIAIIKKPLVDIAQKYQINIFLSLHLSLAGQALGRRIKGITRTLLHLECPSPENPERLRLWVEKSYSKKPLALGVTMGNTGNIYDLNPPAKINADQGSKGPEKLGMAIAFISKELANRDRSTVDLVNDWESKGGSHGTLFNARRKMVADGTLTIDDTKKPQMCRLVSQNPTF